MLLPLILKTLQARRARSFLTVLGIGTSIAVIIAFITMSSTLKSELGEAAAYTKADVIAVQKVISGLSGLIDESIVDRIENSFKEVEQATGFLVTGLRLSDIQSLTIIGLCPEDRDMYLRESELSDGRFVENSGEIAVGKIAQVIHGIEIGNIVTFESAKAFNVVGIYETGNSIIDSGAMIPLHDAQELTNSSNKVTMIAVYLKPEIDASTMCKVIEDEIPYLKISPAATIMEDLSSDTVDSANTFAWVFSTIAIIMAMIGTANTMTMSVSERTREIGILRAVGWTPWKIMKLILGESLILSVGGFVIGIILGIATVYIISSLPRVSTLVSPSFSGITILIALGVALLLGLVGGAYPAYKACRLSPMEALRYE